jgi:aspartate/methionine/tyrosine aminotransferase
MKRAARMDGIAGFGIDRVAAAVFDPDVLRLENLDTDLPLPVEAVPVTRSALDDPVSNSWLPFTGDLGLRDAISAHVASRHGRVYDPVSEVVVTCGGPRACSTCSWRRSTRATRSC